MLNDTILNAGANAMRTLMSHYSLHTVIPDSGGSGEGAPRRPSAWAAPANGDLTSAAVSFTGGVAMGPVKAVGFWNAQSGGTFYGYYPLQGDQQFNGLGEYTVNAFTLVGSSS